MFLTFCFSTNAMKYHTKMNLISLISESVKQFNPIPERIPDSYEPVLFSESQTFSMIRESSPT